MQTLGFVLLVVATAAAVVVIVARAARARRPAIVVALAIAAWLAITLLASRAGVLALDGGPPRIFVLPWLVIATGLVASRTGTGRAVIAAMPLSQLIALDVFRVGVELALWGLAARGQLAVELTFHGYNFDIVVGLTALPVAALVATRPRLAIAWHAAGLLLLAAIVTQAVLSAPGPQHVLAYAPVTTIVAEPPYIWLPAFLVPLAALTHLIGLSQARARVSRSAAIGVSVAQQM